MLATEFKERIEQMSRGAIEINVLENKEVLIRPAVDWANTPPHVFQVFRDFMMTPLEER